MGMHAHEQHPVDRGCARPAAGLAPAGRSPAAGGVLSGGGQPVSARGRAGAPGPATHRWWGRLGLCPAVGHAVAQRPVRDRPCRWFAGADAAVAAVPGAGYRGQSHRPLGADRSAADPGLAGARPAVRSAGPFDGRAHTGAVAGHTGAQPVGRGGRGPDVGFAQRWCADPAAGAAAVHPRADLRTGAVSAVDAGLSPSGHLSVLAALFLVAALGAPPATAAALRISLG
mgnify:CR=1 FL=1